MAIYDIQENLDSIPEDQRDSYTEENGVYKRDMTEDYKLLQVKKGEVEKHKTKAEKERDELQSWKTKQETESEAERARIKEEAFQEALKSNKSEQINESWQNKYNTDLTEQKSKFESEIESLRKENDGLTRGRDVANAISSIKWGDNTDSMVSLLKDKLNAQTISIKTDNGYETRIKNPDGTASAVTLAEHVKKEIIDSGNYTGMLAGNQASGGGANKKSGNGAAGGGQKANGTIKAQMDETWGNTN